MFFALLPLLALVIGVLALVYGPERAQSEVAAILRQIYPSATAQETRIARELVQGRTLSLGIGIVGTLFSVTAIHDSIDTALAQVLGKEGKRRFIRSRLEALAFVGGLTLLAFVSIAASYGFAAVEGLLDEAGAGPALRLALALASPVLGLVIGFAFFYLVYRVVPRRRVGRRAAAEAALVSAVLWEVAKLALGFFTRAAGIFAAYGPLAFAAALLTWIYLTAVIILIGAEVTKTRGTA
jgi:membrane protein